MAIECGCYSRDNSPISVTKEVDMITGIEMTLYLILAFLAGVILGIGLFAIIKKN